MNLTERSKLTQQFFTDCQLLLEQKGASYAPLADAYANFERRSVALGISPSAVMLGDLTKHIDALTTLISGSVDKPLEDIHHRCMDAANYLALIAVYAAQKEKKQ
jgi:hypothetical protein